MKKPASKAPAAMAEKPVFNEAEFTKMAKAAAQKECEAELAALKK